MTSRWKAWRASRPFGPLGDTMTPGERATWRAMRVYRRWSVFFGLQVLTAIWWVHSAWFPGGLEGWNLLWSDLAIVVEMMVGIAFLNQAMRDGAVVRQELRELKDLVLMVKHEQALIRKIAERVQADDEA